MYFVSPSLPYPERVRKNLAKMRPGNGIAALWTMLAILFSSCMWLVPWVNKHLVSVWPALDRGYWLFAEMVVLGLVPGVAAYLLVDRGYMRMRLRLRKRLLASGLMVWVDDEIVQLWQQTVVRLGVDRGSDRAQLGAHYDLASELGGYTRSLADRPQERIVILNEAGWLMEARLSRPDGADTSEY